MIPRPASEAALDGAVRGDDYKIDLTPGANVSVKPRSMARCEAA